MITARIETITPAMAEEYLKLNARNRRRSPSNVLRLLQAAKTGHWGITPNGIGFDRDGNLVDGQHRLEMVVRYGKPLEFLVVRGLDPDVFVYLDNGKRRSAGDVLSIEGFENTHATAATFRVIKGYQIARDSGGSLQSVLYNVILENYEIPTFADRHFTVPDWVKFGRQVQKHCPSLTSKAAVTAALYIAGLQNEFVAKQFVDEVVTGEGLRRGDPGLALRNKPALRDSDTSGKKGVVTSFSFAGRALEARLKHRPLSQISNKLDRVPDLGDV